MFCVDFSEGSSKLFKFDFIYLFVCLFTCLFVCLFVYCYTKEDDDLFPSNGHAQIEALVANDHRNSEVSS